jgi:hypothetical protein
MTQLALWQDEDLKDKRPLPLIVAAKWAFGLQYHVVNGQHIYALQDWVRGMIGGKPEAVRQQVRRLIADSDMGLNVTVEKYLAANGKRYEMPFVADEDLYRVAQALRPLNKREKLSEVHNAIMRYLAKAGAFVDKARRDPKWAAARLEGVIARSAFTEALAQTVIDMTQQGYGTATNDVYRGVFHRDTAQLKSTLNTDKPREKMSQPALHYLGIAEWACAQHIGEAESISFSEARTIIQDVAGLVGVQVGELERHFNIDIVTGKPPLPSGARS